MGIRRELKPGSIIKMPNKGCYTIFRKIGEGGFSLIYSGKTMTNGYPVIIKEFFPIEHAHRAPKTRRSGDGMIIEKKDGIYPDIGFDKTFAEEKAAFEEEGRLSIQAHRISYQVIPFFDCGNGYAILPQWSQSLCTFEDIMDKWQDSPPRSIDPYYPDHGRIYFAATAICSLLNAVSLIHSNDLLHLDISPGNVVWSERDCIYNRSGIAFLTDFGCALPMTEGSCPAERVMSCNKIYAAPEYVLENGRLTAATDIYSVGRLLAYLCYGERALYSHANINNLAERLAIQREDSETLNMIIQKATSRLQEDRYQSADEMEHDIQKLLDVLTPTPFEKSIFKRVYPIFPDDSDAVN